MTRTQSLTEYSASLAQSLRLKGMPEPDIEAIVSEVAASEVSDPVAEFGPSRDYAEHFPVLTPVARGGKLWWWGFAVGVLWAVIAILLLATGTWTAPAPALLVGAPLVGCVLLGGLVSTVQTARRRPWQRN